LLEEEKMKKRILWISLIVTALALSSCASRAVSTPSYDKALYDGSTAPGMPAFAATAYAPSAQENSTGTGVSGSEPAFQQMIIMNANLEIATDDPGLTMSAIQKLASDMGGFTVSSNIYKVQTSMGVEVPEASITVRVPAAKLNDALAQIKAMTGDASKYTLSENISGQDVSQEYTDLKSRLRNLEEANTKLTEFYDKATKTEDALAIYTQKMQVTEQIEVIKGQMQYYEQSSAKSAIAVRIVAKETIAPITVAGWQPAGIFRDALQALINFGKGLVNFLIWLIILVVTILLVIGLPIFFFVRFLTRRNRRAQAAKLEAMQKAMKEQIPPYPSKK
jgi:flagellar basal body-associated protein FliL